MASKARELANLGNAYSDGALSNRNRIINGSVIIDQRSNGGAATVNGGYASADRWKAGNNTNTGTIQQISSTLSGYKNSLKYTASGSGAFFQLGQQIEFANCYDLQNKTVTISFRAKANNTNSGSTAFTVRTRTIAGVDGTCVFVGANSDTSITLTNSDSYYTVTRTLPATFGSLSVEFVLGSHVSGDGFEITGIQLEVGDTSTPFEHRSTGQELFLCQRYYQRYMGGENVRAALSGNGGNTSFPTMFLVQTLRAAPSVSVSSAGDFYSEGLNGGKVTVASLSGNAAFKNTVTFYVGVSSGITGSGTNLLFKNATGYIALDAEL
jgi:hypothetical protein